MKRLIYLGLILLVIALLAWAFMPQPAEVDLAEVVRGPLTVTVDEEARTRIRDRYIIHAPLAGQTTRIDLEPGDTVQAGQTLLTSIAPTLPQLLDPRATAEARSRVNAAEARLRQVQPALEQAQAELEIARSEYQRLGQLLETAAISPREVDDARLMVEARAAAVRSAQIQAEVARFELNLAQAALTRVDPQQPEEDYDQRLPLLAPHDGRVLQVFQKSAAVVQAGAPLLEIGDVRNLEVEIEVLSVDAVRIQPGAQVIFQRWGSEQDLHGRVRTIEPTGFTKISALGVEEQRVRVICDFVDPIEQRQSLGHAYRVEARVVIWHADDAIKVPTGALFRSGDQWQVFTLHNGSAQVRSVALGQMTGLEAQVLSGLEPGERVIVHPSDRIQDGVRVVERNAGQL
jgi:HlyD family secretion protein